MHILKLKIEIIKYVLFFLLEKKSIKGSYHLNFEENINSSPNTHLGGRNQNWNPRVNFSKRPRFYSFGLLVFSFHKNLLGTHLVSVLDVEE